MKKLILQATYNGAHGQNGLNAGSTYTVSVTMYKGKIMVGDTPSGTPLYYNNIFEFITAWSVGKVLEEQKEERALTFGERAVGLTTKFGEADILPQIITATQTCADAIDQMNDLRELSTSGEYKALSTIACRSLQRAQMDMVKAITWKD